MSNQHPADDDRVDFGFRRVTRGERDRMVRGLFARVAGRYDLMNDLMSGTLHRAWRQSLIDWLRPRAGEHIVDVAGGTGDIAKRIILATDDGARVVVCDATYAMVAEGCRREAGRPIAWVVGAAEQLPFADASADAVTIAFGLRNVTDRPAALAETRRVLKPGGRYACLELSHVTLPLLRRAYDRYSFAVVPRLGGLVAGDADAYRYLVESIRRFPTQDELAALMSRAGLGRVRYRNLAGGIAALHTGWRI